LGTIAESTTSAAQLYERHSELVFRYCLRMLRSREEAEDASQTTFVQALRSLRRGVVPTFEQAWLLTIAKNECLSRYRSGKRRRELEVARDPHTLAEVAEAPGNGDGTLIGVQDALTRLPPMQRRALLLREWKGHSYAEIADELSLSQGAVEALLFRARRSLARELGENARTGRKRAFDIASLLGALKSALSGGIGVKAAAVGIAAIASVGVVAGRSHMSPAPTHPAKPLVRNVAPTATPTSETGTPTVRQRSHRVAARQPVATRTAGKKRAPIRENHQGGAGSGTPGTPASGAPQTSAPSKPTAPAQPVPTQPAPSTPTAPAVPEVPKVQLPQATPPVTVEVETPPIQVPQLPLLPPVPPIDLPDVKVEVPPVELPKVPGLPILP
jgi:RNA polymerase sigma-70 factor (ECF subfamily)